MASIQSPDLWLQPFRLVRTLFSAWQTGGDHLWMQRLRRVFAIDLRVCPRCAGPVRVIAAVTEPALISTILQHLDRREGSGAGARAPPAQSLH